MAHAGAPDGTRRAGWHTLARRMAHGTPDGTRWRARCNCVPDASAQVEWSAHRIMLIERQAGSVHKRRYYVRWLKDHKTSVSSIGWHYFFNSYDIAKHSYTWRQKGSYLTWKIPLFENWKWRSRFAKRQCHNAITHAWLRPCLQLISIMLLASQVGLTSHLKKYTNLNVYPQQYPIGTDYHCHRLLMPTIFTCPMVTDC